MRTYLGRLWTNTRLAGGLSACALLGGAALVPALKPVSPLLGMLLFVLVYTLYDAVGWGTGVHWPGRWHDRISVAPYRLIQHAFMASLLLNVGLLFGWRSAAAGLVAWWCGACDVLFYPLLRQALPSRGPEGEPYHYHWMERWSIHGVIRLTGRVLGLRYACHRFQLVSIAVFGLLAGAVLALWPVAV